MYDSNLRKTRGNHKDSISRSQGAKKSEMVNEANTQISSKTGSSTRSTKHKIRRESKSLEKVKQKQHEKIKSSMRARRVADSDSMSLEEFE